MKTKDLLVANECPPDRKWPVEAFRAPTDEEILAQPCVVEAMQKAREDVRKEIAADLKKRSRDMFVERTGRCPTLEEVPEPHRAWLLVSGSAGGLMAAACVYRDGGLLADRPVTPRTVEMPAPGAAGGPPEPTED